MQYRPPNLRQISVSPSGPPTGGLSIDPANTGLDPVVGLPAIEAMYRHDMLLCINSHEIRVDEILRNPTLQNQLVDTDGPYCKTGPNPLKTLRVDLPHTIDVSATDNLSRSTENGGPEEPIRQMDVNDRHSMRFETTHTPSVTSGSYSDCAVSVIAQGEFAAEGRGRMASIVVGAQHPFNAILASATSMKSVVRPALHDRLMACQSAPNSVRSSNPTTPTGVDRPRPEHTPISNTGQISTRQKFGCDSEMTTITSATFRKENDSQSTEAEVLFGHRAITGGQDISRSLVSRNSKTNLGLDFTDNREVNAVALLQKSPTSGVRAVTPATVGPTHPLVQGTTLSFVYRVGGQMVRWVIGNVLLPIGSVDNASGRSPEQAVSILLVTQPNATDPIFSTDIGSWLKNNRRAVFVDIHRVFLTEAAVGKMTGQGGFEISFTNFGTLAAGCIYSNQTIVLQSRNPRCLTRVANSLCLVKASGWMKGLELTNPTISINCDPFTIFERKAICVLQAGNRAVEREPAIEGLHRSNTAERTGEDGCQMDEKANQELSREVATQSMHRKLQIASPVGDIDPCHYETSRQLGTDHRRLQLSLTQPVIATPSSLSDAVCEAVQYVLFNASTTSWTYGDSCAAETQPNAVPARRIKANSPVDMFTRGSHAVSGSKEEQGDVDCKRLLSGHRCGQSLTDIYCGHEASEELPAGLVASVTLIDVLARHQFPSSAAQYDFAMRSGETKSVMQAATRFFFRQRLRPQQSHVDDVEARFPANLVKVDIVDCGQASHAIVPALPVSASCRPKTDIIDVLVTQPETTCLRHQVHHSTVVLPSKATRAWTVMVIPQYCNRASSSRRIDPSVRRAKSRMQVSEHYFPPLRTFQLPQLVLADYLNHKMHAVSGSQFDVGVQNLGIRSNGMHPDDGSAIVQATKSKKVRSRGPETTNRGTNTCVTNLAFRQLRILRYLRRYTNPLRSYLQANWSLSEILATRDEINDGLQTARSQLLVMTDKRSLDYLVRGNRDSLISQRLVVSGSQGWHEQFVAADPQSAKFRFAHMVATGQEGTMDDRFKMTLLAHQRSRPVFATSAIDVANTVVEFGVSCHGQWMVEGHVCSGMGVESGMAATFRSTTEVAASAGLYGMNSGSNTVENPGLMPSSVVSSFLAFEQMDDHQLTLPSLGWRPLLAQSSVVQSNVCLPLTGLMDDRVVRVLSGMGTIDCIASTANADTCEAMDDCPGVAVPVKQDPEGQRTPLARISSFHQSIEMTEACRYQTCSEETDLRAA